MVIPSKKQLGIISVLVVALVALGSIYTLDRKKINKLAEENNTLATALETESQTGVELRTRMSELQATIDRLKNDNATITALLTTEQKRSDAYKNQLGEVTSTVETLTKLTTTDKELLQKYSRVYFLSENYVPSALTNIDTKYLHQKDRPLQIHDRVWPFLKRMLDTAAADGVEIRVISAYRSFNTQQTLKSQYKVLYGAGTANQFSADQGYSEHQLGTTLDFTTPTLGADFERFENTEAYRWLRANAHRHGFVLSYPKNNAFFQFEPWHWRFVGIGLAGRMFVDEKTFYEYDQRFIDNYLVEIFNVSEQ